MAISLRSRNSVVSYSRVVISPAGFWVKSNGWSRELGRLIKKGSNQRLKHFSATCAFNCRRCTSPTAPDRFYSRAIATGPFMENPNERNLLRRAELMAKHCNIIAKSAKWMELERERELERIAKAERDAAAGEQNLLNSIENERAAKNRLEIRQQLRFSKAGRRASRRAVNAMKKTVEIADGTFDFPLLMDATGSSSRTVFKTVTGLRLVQETEDDVREFLQSIK